MRLPFDTARSGLFPQRTPDPRSAEPESVTDRRTEGRTSGHELVLVKWNDPTGRSRAERARIIDRSKNGLGLFTASAIPVRTAVSVSGGTSVRGVVQNCREEHDGYTIGLLRVSPDRRVSERRLVRGDATLIWRDADGPEQTISAPVLNATGSGLQVQTSVAIPVPALVRVIGEGFEQVAESCYQERNGDRFLVGLRFLTQSAGEAPAAKE